MKQTKEVMMRVHGAFFTFALLLSFALPPSTLRAQVPPAPAPEVLATTPVATVAVDEEVKAKIEQLLELMNTKKTMNLIVDEMLRQFRTAYPKAPEQLWVKVKEEVLSKAFLDMLINIYATHFTRQDIEELIDFWSSPVGQKFLKEQPQILKESMAASSEYMKGAKERIHADLQKWEAEQKAKEIEQKTDE